MPAVPLSDLRWGRAIDLMPAQATQSTESLPGQDASGASSTSPDSARDWTITADRVFTGSGTLAQFDLVIQWGTGGLQQEVAIPLSPGGIVHHVVGTDVRTFLRPVAYGAPGWTGTDIAKLSVAPGRPSRNRFADRAFVEAEVTIGNQVVDVAIPNYARRVRIRPWSDAPELPVPWDMQVLQIGEGSFRTWDGPVPSPYYIEQELIFGAETLRITAEAVPAFQTVAFFIEWELDS